MAQLPEQGPNVPERMSDRLTPTYVNSVGLGRENSHACEPVTGLPRSARHRSQEHSEPEARPVITHLPSCVSANYASPPCHTATHIERHTRTYVRIDKNAREGLDGERKEDPRTRSKTGVGVGRCGQAFSGGRPGGRERHNPAQRRETAGGPSRAPMAALAPW
jgi:hypothetical protein